MQRVAKIEYDQGQQIGCGQGQNSKVFLATDPQIGGILAVKEIPKASFINGANFWAEAQAMFCAAHEHVVPIQYACETADSICLAMPYFRRGSLTDRIATGPLRPMEVIRVGQGLLSGLARIHVARQLHFDIKPANILFSDNDEAMVADFGQARAIGPNGVTTPPPTLYNPGIPPELLAMGQGTIASDVYQAGLTLYRATNGNQFFNDQMPAPADLSQEIVNGAFPDRDKFMPHVPRSLRGVLRKSLELDSASRYASAREFATALGRIYINNDWATACLPGNQMDWTCNRSGRPQVVVRLRSQGKKWKVTVHHEKPGVSRATKKILWGHGFTVLQATSHLRGLFQALE